jgi:succinoglycan biosynthesis protein ExoM
MVDCPHISICICTYKRPDLLKRLLPELSYQKTEGLFNYSIVVTDNDRSRSAEQVVFELNSKSPVDISYCVQPQQNIALARNTALASAKGDFVAFIDDDEIPIRSWLITLFKACQTYQVDGVLGPVKPYFEVQPPDWVIKGKFYDRPSFKTGLVIDWPKGRTGNTLLKRHILDGCEPAFRPEFRTGEDQDFFRRMIERGYKFVWCHEAIAYEIVPPLRWKLSFMLRRALLQGTITPLHSRFGLQKLLRAAISVTIYAIALPFLAVLGQHLFVRYLLKTAHHFGQILGTLGLSPIKESYITE